MSKRNVSLVLFVIGMIILTVSIFRYQHIKVAQKEMLIVHEQSKVMKAPVVLQESIALADQNAVPVQQIVENKVVSERSAYQNGQMTIEIPSLKVNAAVVKGTTRDLLKKGPGIYEISPLPDEADGNVCIAGHRTTYGSWFRNVDKLKKGDEIALDYNGIKYIYQVEKVFIVNKDDWSITEPQGYSAITLSSCHPLQSSKQRIVVRGKLVE